ncbi:hypothetical protein AC1031_011311 [Aphanomyces cochlioides]|nr:hypothetical protein AC1031_011311 [Aphanomyces cochlioides]
MSKKSKQESRQSSRPAIKLQDDIVPNIASFIRSPRDFFSFLEALSPARLQGPLKCIWELGLRMKHSTLWPTPTISYELSDFELGTLEECISYYRKVRVKEIANLEWLEMFVHPKTEILWTINYQFSSRRWDRLTDFRLTRLVLDLDFFDDEEVLVYILPDLHHLKSLVLSFQHQLPSLATILARVAASKQLTEFELYKRDKQNYNLAITDSMVQDVLTWLRKQPVRVFRIQNWVVQNSTLAQTLFETMFNCPTMHRLVVYNCDLDDIDFSKCTFQMYSLEIWRGMSSVTFYEMVTHLLKSKVTKFKDELAPCLTSSRLKTLILRQNHLTDESAIAIAQAIQKNGTISKLDVRSNFIGHKGAHRLFESVTDPKRLVQTKWIGIGGNILLWKFEELKELAAERNVKLLTRVPEEDVAYNDKESNSEDYFYSDEEVVSESADY